MDAHAPKNSPPTGVARERTQPEPNRISGCSSIACGEIGYCNNSLAKLIGRKAADLKGLAVTSILQQLPLKQATPDGNVGMMPNYMGRRFPLDLVLDDGRSLPMFGLVRSIRLGTGPAFIVQLKPRGRPGRRRPDV